MTAENTVEKAMQLVITTDMNSLPAAIEFNYAELRGRLEAYLSKFDGLIVEEDGIRAAEADRADINRVAKAIARARIDTKNRYLVPFQTFEGKAKELEALCKSAEAKIAEQLAGFEERRRAEKLETLRKMYGAALEAAFPRSGDGDQPERKSPHWKAWFAAKTDPAAKGNWLLKTCTEKAAQAEMEAEIARCVEVLRKVREVYAARDGEIRARAEVAACKAFSFEQAVTEVVQAERDREAAEALRKRREEEAAARAERAAAEHAARTLAAPAPEAPAAEPAPEVAPSRRASSAPPAEVEAAAEEVYSATFRVFGTREQFRQLNDALNEIGVNWERV